MCRIFRVLQKLVVAPGIYLLQTTNIRPLHKDIASALFFKSAFKKDPNPYLKGGGNSLAHWNKLPAARPFYFQRAKLLRVA